jgi:hypothetical protein
VKERKNERSYIHTERLLRKGDCKRERERERERDQKTATKKTKKKPELRSEDKKTDKIHTGCCERRSESAS